MTAPRLESIGVDNALINLLFYKPSMQWQILTCAWLTHFERRNRHFTFLPGAVTTGLLEVYQTLFRAGAYNL